MSNREEDAIIARIDAERAGMTDDLMDYYQGINRGVWRFCLREIEDCFNRAELFPQYTEGQLAARGDDLAKNLGQARRSLHEFDGFAGAAVSRRKLRRLNDDDDDVDLQRRLREIEMKIADLERKHDEVIQCLYSRRFLRDLPEIVAIALKLQRKTDKKQAAAFFQNRYAAGWRWKTVEPTAAVPV